MSNFPPQRILGMILFLPILIVIQPIAFCIVLLMFLLVLPLIVIFSLLENVFPAGVIEFFKDFVLEFGLLPWKIFTGED